MADTFLNYEKQCKDTQGHIKRIYVLPFVFYNETLIKSEGMNLTVFPTSTVYRFDCWGNYSQNTTTEKGNVQWNHSVEVNLPKVYEIYDINIFYRNDFRIIVETNNGHLIMFGTNNGLACEISNNSGNSKTEFNGFTLKFDGIEEKPGLLISTLGDFFNVYLEISEIKYGYLYNYYSARGDKDGNATQETSITSSNDWVLPSIVNCRTLSDYLGIPGDYSINNDAGIHMKESGTTYWAAENGSDNSSGFNARGAGGRSIFTGLFGGINESTSYWLSNNSSVSGSTAELDVTADGFLTSGGYLNPTIGKSVRLIKTSTTLTHGQTGLYTGNDGKLYRTICIGTQEWLADNLAETKYRDGTTIPIETDNTEWSNLTTGARCVYDNDESNK